MTVAIYQFVLLASICVMGGATFCAKAPDWESYSSQPIFQAVEKLQVRKVLVKKNSVPQPSVIGIRIAMHRDMWERGEINYDNE